MTTGTALGFAAIMTWSAVCFGIGYNIRDAQAIQQVAQQQKDDMAAFKQLEDRFYAQSTKLDQLSREQQNATQTITKYVDRVVERPIYRSDCFDDDGLRLANAALLGKAKLAAQPDSALPGSNATGGR